MEGRCSSELMLTPVSNLVRLGVFIQLPPAALDPMPEEIEVVIHGLTFLVTILDTHVSWRLSWPLRSGGRTGAEGVTSSGPVSAMTTATTSAESSRSPISTCPCPLTLPNSASESTTSPGEESDPQQARGPHPTSTPSLPFPSDGHPNNNDLSWSLVIDFANLKEFVGPKHAHKVRRWPDGTIQWLDDWGVMGATPGPLSGRGGGFSFQRFPHHRRNVMTIVLWALDRTDQLFSFDGGEARKAKEETNHDPKWVNNGQYWTPTAAEIAELGLESLLDKYRFPELGTSDHDSLAPPGPFPPKSLPLSSLSITPYLNNLLYLPNQVWGIPELVQLVGYLNALPPQPPPPYAFVLFVLTDEIKAQLKVSGKRGQAEEGGNDEEGGDEEGVDDDDDDDGQEAGQKKGTLGWYKTEHRSKQFASTLRADINGRISAIRHAAAESDVDFSAAIRTLQTRLQACPILVTAIRKAAATVAHAHVGVVRIPDVIVKGLSPIGKHTVFDISVGGERCLFIAHYGQQGGVRGHQTVEETVAALSPCGMAGELVTQDRAKFMTYATSYPEIKDGLHPCVAPKAQGCFTVFALMPEFSEPSWFGKGPCVAAVDHIRFTRLRAINLDPLDRPLLAAPPTSPVPPSPTLMQGSTQSTLDTFFTRAPPVARTTMINDDRKRRQVGDPSLLAATKSTTPSTAATKRPKRVKLGPSPRLLTTEDLNARLGWGEFHELAAGFLSVGPTFMTNFERWWGECLAVLVDALLDMRHKASNKSIFAFLRYAVDQYGDLLVGRGLGVAGLTDWLILAGISPSMLASDVGASRRLVGCLIEAAYEWQVSHCRAALVEVVADPNDSLGNGGLFNVQNDNRIKSDVLVGAYKSRARLREATVLAMMEEGAFDDQAVWHRPSDCFVRFGGFVDRWRPRPAFVPSVGSPLVGLMEADGRISLPTFKSGLVNTVVRALSITSASRPEEDKTPYRIMRSHKPHLASAEHNGNGKGTDLGSESFAGVKVKTRLAQVMANQLSADHHELARSLQSHQQSVHRAVKAMLEDLDSRASKEKGFFVLWNGLPAWFTNAPTIDEVPVDAVARLFDRKRARSVALIVACQTLTRNLMLETDDALPLVLKTDPPRGTGKRKGDARKRRAEAERLASIKGIAYESLRVPRLSGDGTWAKGQGGVPKAVRTVLVSTLASRRTERLMHQWEEKVWSSAGLLGPVAHLSWAWSDWKRASLDLKSAWYRSTNIAFTRAQDRLRTETEKERRGFIRLAVQKDGGAIRECPLVDGESRGETFALMSAEHQALLPDFSLTGVRAMRARCWKLKAAHEADVTRGGFYSAPPRPSHPAPHSSSRKTPSSKPPPKKSKPAQKASCSLTVGGLAAAHARVREVVGGAVKLLPKVKKAAKKRKQGQEVEEVSDPAGAPQPAPPIVELDVDDGFFTSTEVEDEAARSSAWGRCVRADHLGSVLSSSLERAPTPVAASGPPASSSDLSDLPPSSDQDSDHERHAVEGEAGEGLFEAEEGRGAEVDWDDLMARFGGAGPRWLGGGGLRRTNGARAMAQKQAEQDTESDSDGSGVWEEGEDLGTSSLGDEEEDEGASSVS